MKRERSWTQIYWWVRNITREPNNYKMLKSGQTILRIAKYSKISSKLKSYWIATCIIARREQSKISSSRVSRTYRWSINTIHKWRIKTKVNWTDMTTSWLQITAAPSWQILISANNSSYRIWIAVKPLVRPTAPYLSRTISKIWWQRLL